MASCRSWTNFDLRRKFMSPVSRSRKKKSGRADPDRRRSSSPFAPVLAAAASLVDERSPLEPQAWASDILGAIWLASWGDNVEDPDQVMAEQIGALMEYALAQRSPAALATLRALGAVGEEETRELATEAADHLAAVGVAEPSWAASAAAAEFAAGYTASDTFGDIELISLAFRTGDSNQALIVMLAHLDGPYIVKIVVGEGSADDLAAAIEELSGDSEMSDPKALTAAEVWERLDYPLENLLEHGPAAADVIADIFEDIDGEPAAGWALLRARLDDLPDEESDQDDELPDEQGDQAVRGFLAGRHAKQLPDQELARGWAELVAGWADDCGRSPYRWGPLSLGFFLMEEVAEHAIIDEADRMAFIATVGAWIRFTADVQELPIEALELWEEQGPLLLAQFFETYDDPESVAHRSTCPDTFDLRSFDRQAAVLRLADGMIESMSTTMTSLARAGEAIAAARAGNIGPAIDVGRVTGFGELAAAPESAESTVHQLKVALRRTKPPVWRRLEVASTMTLGQLHEVIQAAFDWDDDHLWVFETDHGQFGPSAQLGHQDPDEVTLAQFGGSGTQLHYTFDFGDDWEHLVTVEKVTPKAATVPYPRCTGGKQPDPIQYPSEDDGFSQASKVFDEAAINTRLAAIRQ
jgi:hypothetical protein